MNQVINYKRLIKITNRLLLNKKNKFEIFCIPFFQVIKGNDYHFRNYTFLFSKKIFIFIKNLLISFISIFIFLIKGFFKKNNYNNASFLKHNFDYLFLSHLINEKYLKNKIDFQFGKVPFIHKKKTGIVYLNHISDFNYFNNLKLLEKFPLPIYILLNQSTFNDNIKIIVKVIKQSFKILRLIKKKLNLLELKLIIFGFIKSFSSSVFYNHVLMLEFFLLVKKVKPKFLIFTFEGQSYERIIIYAARLAQPNIKIIGYQNSPLIENQNTVLLKFKPEFMPDEIWTSGKFCANVIKKKLEMPTQILGSPKFIYTKPLIKDLSIKDNKILTCLVAPEGVLSETYILFRFCLDYINSHSNINFIWRLHPEISKSNLLKKFSLFNHNLKKIKFSDNSNEDFLISDLFLYRGTTLATQAVKFGLRPLYLSLGKKDFNIDPLYKFNHIWKKTIYNCDDLNSVANERISNRNKTKFIKKVSFFSQTILQQINYNVIKNLK